MDLPTLLEQAREAGVKLEIVDGELQIGAKASQSHWLERLRPFREELRDYLDPVPTEALEPAETEANAGEPFPVEALPAAVEAYVRQSAEAIGCDPALVALPLLTSLGRSIGCSRVIRLKLGWTEPPIFWSAIIGKSGTHKTPALQAGLKFLEQQQTAALADYRKSVIEFRRDRKCYERELSQWKRQGLDTLPPLPPEPPICRRFSTSDCTIEALSALLANEPDGLVVARDELAGWMGGIAEYKGGRGSDLGHWLACWSAAPLTVDRKTGDTKMIHIPQAAISLVGGIQPDVLRQAIGREHRQDGLCARLLLAMPRPRPVVWTDATVAAETQAAVGELFERLLTLQPIIGEQGEPIPEPLDLTPDAKALWVDYFNRHRAEANDLNDDLTAAWSKLEAYTARFALLFELLDWAAGDQQAGREVCEATLQAAIALTDWFGGEARRVYGLFSESDTQREQRELVDWIARRGGRVTCRKLQSTLQRYRRPGLAEQALALLVRTGQARREVETETGGKPRTDYVLTTKAAEAA